MLQRVVGLPSGDTFHGSSFVGLHFSSKFESYFKNDH